MQTISYLLYLRILPILLVISIITITNMFLKLPFPLISFDEVSAPNVRIGKFDLGHGHFKAVVGVSIQLERQLMDKIHFTY